MGHLIDAAAYMPHGYCLLWKPWLVALHAGSDLGIALAYAAIPTAILLFLKQRPDIRFSRLFGLFAAFILLCGLTHVFGLLTLWVPVYELEGVVKLATAAVSLTTAFVIFPLIPRAVAIPSPAILERTNERLRAEIVAHERTLAELRAARDQLEARVAERTAEIEDANRRLHLLTREIVHRLKNLLAVVTGIAQQTARSSDDKRDFVDKFSGRLRALAGAVDAVSRTDQQAAHLKDLVAAQLGPYLATFADRISVEGPDVEVKSDAAQQIGLALHELATNAVKYGALSGEAGTTTVNWRLNSSGPERTVIIEWTENRAQQASKSAEPPSGRKGLGSALLDTVVPAALKAKSSLVVTPAARIYTLTIPLAALRSEPGESKGARPASGG